jgi:dynein assembly factor 3, axonemal
MSDKYLKSEEQNLVHGLGTELCWGWSPALNFTELVSRRCLGRLLSTGTVDEAVASASGAAPTTSVAGLSDDLDALLADFDASKATRNIGGNTANVDGGNDVHILLCGAADVRHIIRTLAAVKGLRKRQEQSSQADASAASCGPTIHFYLHEPNLRVHARHLFFLQWLCDAVFSFDKLEDHITMFLEVFGNSMLRDITAVQVKDVATKLARAVDREEGQLMGMVDFQFMKAKERDFVESQLKNWGRDASVAHIEGNWNRRLRTEMAERFDNKDNIIDWDFNFHLHDYTHALKFPEYRTWRNTGVAFDYCHINPRKGFQYEYTVPNKTLCHFDKKGNGMYLGDIKNGPFFALGVDTRNTFLHPRNADGTLKYGNGTMAMHNVRAWLYELMCGLEWPWADHAFAWDDAANYNYLPKGTPSDVEYHAEIPKAKFHFVGLDLERFLQPRSGPTSDKPKFDLAFIGSNSTQFMTPQLLSCMSDDGVVVCETAKFIIDCKEETKDRFADKVIELGKAGGWVEDPVATAFTLKDQPPPNKNTGVLTEPQKKCEAKLASKFVIVLNKMK